MNSITIKVLLNLWTKTIANIEKSAIFYLLFKFCFDFKHPNLYIKKKRIMLVSILEIVFVFRI